MEVKRALVIGSLLILTVIIGVAPDLHPPAGTLRQVGLATFQLSVVALCGALMLVILLVASRYTVFWRSFFYPRSYRRSAWTTVRSCGLILAGGTILLFGIFVVGFSYFWANTQEPRLVLVISGWAPNLVALITVAEGIGLTRALVLFGLARTTMRHP